MRGRSWLGSALLVAGCRGFPCTDDIRHPDDTTFVRFKPLDPWADGTYHVEVALDGDVFTCELVIPIDRNQTRCSHDIGVGELEFPEDPETLVILEVRGHVPDNELGVTVRRDEVVLVDETSTDFARDDNEGRDRGKVCAEWTFVRVTVPGPQ